MEILFVIWICDLNYAFKGVVCVKRLAVVKLMCVCGFEKYVVV